MVRGKRLREKQLALVMRQPVRRGRRFGQRNRVRKDLRRMMILLLERGYATDAVAYAAARLYDPRITADTVRQVRLDFYRKALL